jgi:hypothetical protein
MSEYVRVGRNVEINLIRGAHMSLYWSMMTKIFSQPVGK